MSLTRKMLKAMDLDEEKIDQIIEAHTQTVTALKEQRDQYKLEAGGTLDPAAQLERARSDTYKEKYEALQQEMQALQAEYAARQTRAAKESAYRELLRAAGIPDKRLAAVLKVSDLDAVELADGKIRDAEQWTARIAQEWADFIPTATQTGAQTATPPQPVPMKHPGEMSMAEYIQYRKGE